MVVACTCVYVYSQSWALEYYPDGVDDEVCAIGVSGISETEVRRRLQRAGLADCGVEFRIFESQLAGAVFTRSGKVAPGIGVLGGVGEVPGTRNRAVLAAAIGGSGHRSPSRRFALTVAHLFNQVGTG